MRKNYNKLIRDKIPELIEESGRQVSTKKLSQEEYLQALIDKIVEEINDYRSSENEEEIADIYEVLDCLVELKEYEPMHIDYLRMKKRDAQGSYKDRILLEYVEE